MNKKVRVMVQQTLVAS